MLVLRHSKVSGALMMRPLTLCLPIEGGRCGIPFFNRPYVVCVMSISQPEEVNRESIRVTSEDLFAPSLPWANVACGSTLNGEALRELVTLLAAEATGCAAEVLERSIGHATHRVQFGQPIGRFQAVKHLLADMYCNLEIARTAVLWSAKGGLDSRRAAIEALKLCRRVIEGGIQIHGGFGFTWEAGLHYYLRHVLALTSIVGRSLR
jgi:alkylation response protein AidB-like acyl-CoA dehydrogenase